MTYRPARPDPADAARWRPDAVRPSTEPGPAISEPHSGAQSREPAPPGPPPADGATLSVPDVNGLGVAEAATAYAEAGWYVVPLDEGDPRNVGAVVGPGWPDKSSNNPATVRRWFRHGGEAHVRTLGRLGLALHVGRSGAVAFDVDYPEHMPDPLRQAVDTLDPPFQASRSNVAGRGAYMFALPPGVTLGNTAGSLGASWGEVKGRNGTIHAAPTTHHKADEGGRYRWERTGTLPELPGELVRALLAARRRATTASGSRAGSSNVRARVRGLLDTLLAADEGQRNTLLHWTACRFAELVEAGSMPEETAVALLERAGAEIGLEPHEVAATVASGMRTGGEAMPS